MRQSRLGTLVLITLSTLLLAGCAHLPQAGSVGESDPQVDFQRDIAYTFNPAGPAADATPTSIINGFILAATGIQGDFSTARQFLTDSAAQQWDPSAATTIYTGRPIIDDTGGHKFAAELSTVGKLDNAGVLELTPDGSTESPLFQLVQVNGQWRIDNLPDGIHLDSAQFRALFNTQTLYFYDPTYTYAVPDVRWILNSADQTAAIVRALLDGPAEYLDGAVVSAFPQEAELYRDTVPITRSIAQVDLVDETFRNSTEIAEYRMFQQLELTLKRYPGVSEVSMTQERSVMNFISPPSGFEPVDATVTTGNTQIGIDPQSNQLVSYEANDTAALKDFPNVAYLDPTQPTMNRQRDVAAFINGDRNTLYVANSHTQAFEIATGTDLIAPSIDPGNWVYTVTDGNKMIAASSQETGQVHEIMHPWIDHDVDIVSLRISPEGTRAAIVVQPEDGPNQLYVAGLIRGDDNRPQAIGNTFRIQTDEAPNQVVWYSTAEVLAGRVSDRERVELELVGFSGPSVKYKPMLGMINFSAGAGNIYAETADNVYLRVGHNWRAEPKAPTELSYPG